MRDRFIELRAFVSIISDAGEIDVWFLDAETPLSQNYPLKRIRLFESTRQNNSRRFLCITTLKSR